MGGVKGMRLVAGRDALAFKLDGKGRRGGRGRGRLCSHRSVV